VAKGVATLMDTVFLLLISGVASAILFYSAANYGKTLEQQSSALLLDYYARQAVRVMSTATILRPGCDTPDYLLAYLKEKAYFGGLADRDTLETIGGVMSEIMLPLRSAYDYAVAIRVGSSDDSNVYLFAWYREYTGSGFEEKNACYVVNQSSYMGWLAEFRSPTYSYSVPVRFRMKGDPDYYVVGRLQMIIWPAGAGFPDPGGTDLCN